MSEALRRSRSNTQEPLFEKFSDVFEKGFTIDWGIATFLVISHLSALVLTPIAYAVAPAGLWQWMLGWTVLHALLGCLATTAYSHRLIAHGAAKVIRWPVHAVFLFFQLFAVQGSVRRWAAQHVVHHSVDRTGQHHLDPYSATWFTTAWRNFVWSHMVTYFFHHPESREFDTAFESKSEPALVWQDKHYLPLMIVANYVLPFALGLALAGWLGGLCMIVASVAGYVLAQHNTWTVNSVTHMWGFKNGLFSSAKNSYVWLGPLGEGNHHADHHDYARDYRNGFGWSGWMLDPTRYVILSLRSLGLVSGLNRASRLKEVQIIANRRLRDARARSRQPVWAGWEAKLEQLHDEWLAAARAWDQFKLKKAQLKQQIRQAGAARLEATQARRDAAQADMVEELNQRLERVRAEMREAKQRMRAQREAFFEGLQELRRANMTAA
jgi:stearoyl-CoA desaturase (delta-9 desaturase)